MSDAPPVDPNDLGGKAWFWPWFFKGGDGTTPGIKKLATWWSILDLIVGALAVLLVPSAISEVAGAVLLPMVGLFVGMAFAWVGNAHSLLETKEVRAVAIRSPDGFEGWVFDYQLTVLVVLTTVVLWSVAALGVEGPSLGAWFYWIQDGALYGLCSMSVRFCWRTIMETQQLVLLRPAARAAVESQGMEILEDGSLAALPTPTPPGPGTEALPNPEASGADA